MFGLMGDLGSSKLLESIYEMAKAGRLGVPVVGVGRTEYSDDDVRDALAGAVDDPETDVLAAIDISYVPGDATDRDSYDEIAASLDGAERPVVYAALPPKIFEAAAEQVAASDLPDETRLVVEKPFGESADSARRLYDAITDRIAPERLFLVDHFLAKGTVENIHALRFANPWVDRLWRSGPVERLRIEMYEAGGVDGRGSFYESVGAIADVFQNHLMQLLAVTTMDRPAGADAAAFDTARAEILGRIVPIGPDDIVRGQFVGYTDVEDVDDDSNIETFVAARMRIEHPRWDGVPIEVVTGKQLRDTHTTVELESGTGDAEPVLDSVARNALTVELKPDPQVRLSVSLLDASDHAARPEQMVAPLIGDHGPLGDYATMLDSAMAGDRHHFADIDDVIAAWKVVDPILDRTTPLHPYRPGGDGPEGAKKLFG